MADDPQLNKVNFYYIKSPDFRSAVASGVYGGVGPGGLINMNFFIERLPIPQLAQSTVENGMVVGSERIEGKDGFIREVQTNVMLDINSAKIIYDWLGKHIDRFETQYSKK